MTRTPTYFTKRLERLGGDLAVLHRRLSGEHLPHADRPGPHIGGPGQRRADAAQACGAFLLG